MQDVAGVLHLGLYASSGCIVFFSMLFMFSLLLLSNLYTRFSTGLSHESLVYHPDLSSRGVTA